MKKKLFIAAVAFMLAAVAGFAQSADDFEVKQNADNTLTITSYKGTATEVVIPSTLHGLKVTIIGKRAFYNKKLTSVVISDTVTVIEDGAFLSESNYGPEHVNKITKVILGKGLKTIGNGAFASNMLADIVIPDSVTNVGDNAFISNKLTKVTFGKGLKTISPQAFWGNQISELTLPTTIKEIGPAAFQRNKIRALTIPNSVTVIANYMKAYDGAFNDNPLKYLSIPASLAKRTMDTQQRNKITAGIDDGTFGIGNGNEIGNAAIDCIILPANMDEGSMRGNFEITLVNFWISQNKAAGVYMKRGPIWVKASAAEANTFLKEIPAKREAEQKEEEVAKAKTEAKQATDAALAEAIKSGFSVKERGDGSLAITFYTGKDKDVKIPAEIGGKPVTHIELGAFSEKVAAGNITSVTIPDSVIEIGEYAFANIYVNRKKGNNKLATVTWGKGLKKIEKEAFAGNDNLKTINAGTSNVQTQIANDAFDKGFVDVWKSSGNAPKTYTKGTFGGWSAK